MKFSFKTLAYCPEPIAYCSNFVIFFLFISASWGSQGIDSTGVIGAQTCSECHVSESETWQQTRHFKTFAELHRKDSAREIKNKLGLKRIKSAGKCTQCHYTVQESEEKRKVISGVSCESCHGSAKDWLDVHYDYGGPEITRDTETVDHRQERLAAIAKAGMIRPGEIYKLAKNCFECHTVPDEDLVNIGGHKAGSKIELVSWLLGENRHNFIDSDGKVNRDDSPERKRILFVVGRLLDLEYAFRGVAKATKKANYAVKMAKRAKRAIARIGKILELKSIPELEEIHKLAKAQKLKLNNEANLTAAAEGIREISQKFTMTYNGGEFPEIDPLIPTPEKYRGTPQNQ